MSIHRILLAAGVLVALAAIGAPAAEPVKPKDGPLEMKFVPLPKATFYMGWDDTAKPSKKGVKTEIKEDFEIAVHTVTQEQWERVMGRDANESRFRGKDDDEKIRHETHMHDALYAPCQNEVRRAR